MVRRPHLLALLVAAIALAAPVALQAEEGNIAETEGIDDDHDHDRARDLREHGEIAPLREILDRLSRDYPGDVMSVRLAPQGGRWIYLIRILQRDGRLVDLSIDAKSTDVLPDEDDD